MAPVAPMAPLAANSSQSPLGRMLFTPGSRALGLDGVKECYYLEPSRYTPFYSGHPCIEAGSYHVVLTMSPHLGYVCPEVLNVPGRTEIR
jgi:Family of unknown function (DUF5675)